MIYLSRLLLNPRSRQAQTEFRDPYQMHRTISRAFGDMEWVEARCLFRTEEARDQEAISVLVQSRLAPDWERLVPAANYWVQPPTSKALELNIPQGKRLSFRLRANPTVCQNGKRNPLRGDTEQLKWLQNKSERSGFQICQARVTCMDILRFQTAAKHPVTLQSVLFDGMLIVTEADIFLQTIESGLGSGKGFGCGLLSVARALL
jgi:CRISPR system Cascade subunit CasE